MDGKGQQESSNASLQAKVAKAVKVCRLLTCNKEFMPKRKDQEFCCPEHTKAHYQRVYEAGQRVINSKGMHHRSMKSPQLQRLYSFLACDGEPKTTREIHLATGLEAVGTAISELRRCGYRIDCEFVGQLETGAKIYEYKLIQ